MRYTGTMEKTPPYSMLTLIPAGSLSLNDPSSEIPLQEITSDDTQALIDRMFVIACGEQGDTQRPTMVGLAAPQLGVNKRVILVGIDAQGNGSAPQLQEFINPVITYRSHETDENREGCYSTGRVCGIVRRATSVHVRGYDRRGKEIDLSAEGFPARIFQHEIDHLDGVRFPDRITEPKHLHWVPEAEFGDYRQHWASWTQYCPRQRWLDIRDGRPFNLYHT